MEDQPEALTAWPERLLSFMQGNFNSGLSLNQLRVSTWSTGRRVEKFTRRDAMIRLTLPKHPRQCIAGTLKIAQLLSNVRQLCKLSMLTSIHRDAAHV
jgi:hypothetical protein